MPFKLVAVVEGSMSLGSILMTEGVHVIAIDTLTNKEMKVEAEKEIKLLSIEKPKNPNMSGKKFHHPLGKTSSDSVMEFLQQHKMGTWRDMQAYVAQQGFAKSSINNGIQRLIQRNRIKRTAPGIYAINPSWKSSD